jgi:prepilin-type N-terminal cleavage/methylation domain-containing protein
MLRNRVGYTLIEVVVVMLLVAVAATIAIPRALRPSPQLQVNLAAGALARDLEQLRMQAIAAKRPLRVRFYDSQNAYSAFLDQSGDRSGTFAESAEEVRGSRLLTRGRVAGLPGVRLERGVIYGVGLVTSGPLGESVSDAVALDDDLLQFNGRGMVAPEGTGGVIFLTHEVDPSAVAAVTITGASAIKAWRYSGGAWIK